MKLKWSFWYICKSCVGNIILYSFIWLLASYMTLFDRQEPGCYNPSEFRCKASMDLHTRQSLLEDITWSIVLGVMDDGPFVGYYLCSCRSNGTRQLRKLCNGGSSGPMVFNIQYWCWFKTWSTEFCLCMYCLMIFLEYLGFHWDQSLAWILEIKLWWLINCLVPRMD